MTKRPTTRDHERTPRATAAGRPSRGHVAEVLGHGLGASRDHRPRGPVQGPGPLPLGASRPLGLGSEDGPKALGLVALGLGVPGTPGGLGLGASEGLVTLESKVTSHPTPDVTSHPLGSGRVGEGGRERAGGRTRPHAS